MSRLSGKALALLLAIVIVALLILFLGRNQPNSQTATPQQSAAQTEPPAVAEPASSTDSSVPAASTAAPASPGTTAAASPAPISDADCNALKTEDPELAKQHLDNFTQRSVQIDADLEEAGSISAQLDGLRAHNDDLGRLMAQLLDRAHQLPTHDAGMLLATEGVPIAGEQKQVDEAATAALNRLLALNFELISASDKATLDGCYLGHAFDENLARRTAIANGILATRRALDDVAKNLAEADSFLAEASGRQQ